jgi:hypothetical protein
MTIEYIDRLIDILESAIRDLKNERNKIILSERRNNYEQNSSSNN